MKILLVTTCYYPNMLGGTEQSVKLLAEGLKESGHDVYVISADKKEIEKEEINGVKVIRINLKYRSESLIWKLIRKGFEYRNYMIKNILVDIIDEIKPDVIHTNSLFYISPIIWKIAKDKNIKLVHTLRDYWGVCPKCTLLNKKDLICKKRSSLCKLHQYNYSTYAKYVDIVTAPSSFTLNKYSEYGLFNNAKKATVLNAINLDFEESKRIIEHRINRDFKTIKFLFMGAIVKYKGIEYLIRSFKEIDNNNIELIICGEGEMVPYIKEMIKDDRRIKYLGKVNGKDKEEALCTSDVMIVPSIWYEPFGRVIIEAYKYGMPVIACKIGGITELLDKRASIGVTANSTFELKDAINELSNIDNLKKYISGTIEPLNKYKISKQIQKFEEIYV